MSKERPISMSTPMVRALPPNGVKSQTRRVMKVQPHEQLKPCGTGKWYWAVDPSDLGNTYYKCLYGELGDVLWVREMHYRYGKWVKDGLTKTRKQKWKFMPDKHFAEIRYFNNPPAKIEKNNHRGTGWYKRLARFMFRKDARIFLKITDISVERLQDISAKDAKSEGIEAIEFGELMLGWRNYLDAKQICKKATDSFRTLWLSINGEQSWNANPWVWVITFETTSKAHNE